MKIKIKLLVWTMTSDGEYCEAGNIFGQLRITKHGDGWIVNYPGPAPQNDARWRVFESPFLAMHAAQHDFIYFIMDAFDDVLPKTGADAGGDEDFAPGVPKIVGTDILS